MLMVEHATSYYLRPPLPFCPFCYHPRAMHYAQSIPFRTLIGVCAALAVMGARSVSAQVDVSGEWAATFHEDLAHRGGMRLGDYTGLPLNEAGIRKAQAWDEDARSMRERQCVPHVVTYAMRGPANIFWSAMADLH